MTLPLLGALTANRGAHDSVREGCTALVGLAIAIGYLVVA